MTNALYLTDLQWDIIEAALEKYQMELQQVVLRTPGYEARLRALGDLLYDIKRKKEQP